MPANLENSAVATGLKRSVFNPIPKKGNAKECSNYHRPFRYNLNQIPYNYTVEVRNRIKGLDMIDRVLEKLWTEVLDIVQEAGIKTILKRKKCKKAKWLSVEALQIAMKRGEKQRRKGKIFPSLSEFSTVYCDPHSQRLWHSQ